MYLGLLFLLSIIVLGIVATIPDNDSVSQITMDDLLVGDNVKIKGEMFKVNAYSTVSNTIEVANEKKGTFIVKIDKDITFMLHKSGNERKFVDVIGTKGTVGSDYLDKVKFN